MRVFFFFSLFWLISQNPLDAQILNADRFGVELDSADRFAGNIQLGFDLQQQQTLITQLGTAADLSYLAGDHLFIVSHRHSLLLVDKGSVLNVGFSHFRYRFRPDGKWVPEVFFQYQLEALRGLQSRWIAGMNLKRRIIDEPKIGFSVGLGLMYEKENWIDSDVPSDTEIPYPDNFCFESPCATELIKVNQYFTLKWQLDKLLSFDLTNYIQFVPDRFAVYPRVATDASFTFHIGKFVKYRISYQGSYDSRPPVPTRSLYYGLSQSLGFTF